MSTRANLIISGGTGEQRFTLYHHMDGYPAWLGASILESVWYAQIGTAAMVNRLLKLEDDPGWEMTDGVHGDIEHLYWVEGRPGYREPVIRWAARGQMWDSEAWQNKRQEFTVETFADLVNSDRRAVNARVRVRNEGRSGEWLWDEMPMVEIPDAPGCISAFVGPQLEA